MGENIGDKKISIIDEEGKTIDVVGVTEIKAEDIEPVFEKYVENLYDNLYEYSGSIEMDIKIPKLSRKRFVKLMMGRGFSRNSSKRLLNVYMNMYKSRDYLGFMCFTTYLEGMMSLGEELVII